MTPGSSTVVLTPGHGLRPLPVEVCRWSADFCGAGRGLSMQVPRQHQREIPVGQGFERRGVAQHFGRVGVSAVHAYFFTPRGTLN